MTAKADQHLDVNTNTGAISAQTMTPTTADSLITITYTKKGMNQPTSPSQPSGQTSNQSQPSGQTSSQSQPSGQTSNQSQPSGQTSNQSQPSGQTSNQSQPSGQTSNQSQPSGQTSNQSQPSGQTSNQSQPSGQTLNQSQPSGQTSNQSQPSGQTSNQSQPSGQTSNQSQPSGQTSSQSQPSGQQPTTPGQGSNQPTTPGQGNNQVTTPGQVTNPSQTDNETVIIKYYNPETGETIKTDTVHGQGGTPINYNPQQTITDLENKGYVIIHNGYPTNPQFDHDPATNQTYTITVKHGTTTIGPNSQHNAGTPINPNDPTGPQWPARDQYIKDYTYTVHFVDEHGNKIAPDDVQTVEWTRTLIIDKVTGKILNPNAAWTPSAKKYHDVENPVINGYYTVKQLTEGPAASQSNSETTVTYYHVGKIIPVDQNGNQIASAQTPQYQNDSTNPTKVQANEAVPTVDGYTPSQSTVTPNNPGEDTKVVYTKNSGNTGNSGTTGSGTGTNTSGVANTGNNNGTGNNTSANTPTNGGTITLGNNGEPNTGHTNFIVPSAASETMPTFDTTGLGGSVETPIQNQPLSFTGNGGGTTTTTTTTTSSANKGLPQTGNDNASRDAALAGLAGVAMTSGLMGLALKKKHN